MTDLKRLVLDYRSEAGELVMRVLYSTHDGPNPGTVRWRREVKALVCEGLQDALTALQDGDVTMCGTSGFTTREDILSIASPSTVMSETRVKEKR
jgi:hypothetical protein